MTDYNKQCLGRQTTLFLMIFGLPMNSEAEVVTPVFLLVFLLIFQNL